MPGADHPPARFFVTRRAGRWTVIDDTTGAELLAHDTPRLPRCAWEVIAALLKGDRAGALAHFKAAPIGFPGAVSAAATP